MPHAPRLIVVTGKGGTGKTTVAAALAVGLAAQGRHPLVCELDGRHEIPRLVGGSVATVTIDARAALDEWLLRTLPRPAAGLLRHSGAAGAFIAAAPGARELVTIGKVCDLALAGPRRPVILDAPSSGHALALLGAPRTYAALAAGAVGAGAAQASALLRDATASAIVGVATPTELAVAETIELDARLSDLLGRGLSLVVADGVLEQRFSAADLRRLALLPATARRACMAQDARARSQRPHLARLHRMRPAGAVELPQLVVPALGPAEIRVLAAALAAAAPAQRAA